jgi:hypothetical protein
MTDNNVIDQFKSVADMKTDQVGDITIQGKASPEELAILCQMYKRPIQYMCKGNDNLHHYIICRNPIGKLKYEREKLLKEIAELQEEVDILNKIIEKSTNQSVEMTQEEIDEYNTKLYNDARSKLHK